MERVGKKRDIKKYTQTNNLEYLEQYLVLFSEEFNLTDLKKEKNYYMLAFNDIISQIKNDEFFLSLKRELKEYNDQYHLKTDYELMINYDIDLHIKPFNSYIDKTYRKNCVYNDNYPNAPKKGWYYINKNFSQINDLVRCTLVVKYIDGVEYLVNKIACFCEGNNILCNYDFEAKNEGYYAAHLYISREYSCPKKDMGRNTEEFVLEIQITTDLQNNIKKLLHKHYSRKRSNKEVDNSWMWDYKSNEFATNYLGHILHYLEGMIVEIREKERVD